MCKQFPNYVATVGNMIFEPGAFNVVPQTVTVCVEFRANDQKVLDEIEKRLLQQAEVEAQRFNLQINVQRVEESQPIKMNRQFQNKIATACKHLDFQFILLPSGAGHDAQILGQVCPACMIFVPSVDGYSHSAKEYTRWQDCVNGANVLLHTVLNIACEVIEAS
jgi:hydantoinase/carbamoylase family amidase